MHIRTAKLVCDHCGKSIDIDPSIDEPFTSRFHMKECNYLDWGFVEGKHFCGDCYAAYNAMCDEFKAKLHDVFGI